MSSIKTQSLDAYDDEDAIGFIDGDINIGNPIATFSFAPQQDVKPIPSSSGKASFSFRDKTLANSQRGSTPAVDGEAFTVKRCYQYRPSTLRKLSQLRARHSDVSVYLNTIIDEAVCFYYDRVFSHKEN